ncbi:hypothetical protein WISP_123531 [Willisornis vidua]|uniref:RING-type domain-containing protein n=1 Tax=Willisornis vidua TaxID=1566151 RepID=A0ABQ9CSS7_9PASS|nr:hypothetical protein WISP_123531 [Willisornis vidua]
MASETDGNCPICQDTQKDVASTLPCRHRFCLGCILRWVQRNPVCPLCRRTIGTIWFSDYGGGDYLEIAISAPEELPDGSSLAGTNPGGLDENSPHPSVASHPFSPQQTLPQVEQQGSGSILPDVWADLFRQQQHLLDPMRPWLRRRLEGIYWGRWWVVEVMESSILHGLCVYGLNAEVLIEVLELLLEEHTAPLIHGVINIIVGQCSEEAQRLLRSAEVSDESNGPVARISSSSSSSSSFSISRSSRFSSSSSSGSSSSNSNTSSSSSSNSSSSSSSSSNSSSSSCSSSQEGTPASSPAGSDVEEEADTTQASPTLSRAAVTAPHSQSGQAVIIWGTLASPRRRVPSPQHSPQPSKRPCHQQH